ncbi:MAG: hypothetical protein JWQ01_3697, partial [Massilia sp.]|nr:hypothetical protein [Massilia sp.]
LSRWRTIHELAVTAMFISEHGKPVAERYAAHLAADSIKTARQYQKFASVLGYRPIGPKEQKRLDKEAQELAQKFGKTFLNDYGWAADALKISQPTFASIEAAVNLDRFRPYFKLASGTVHAGAKGTYHRLGVLDDRDLILVGSSNVGLEEAGRLVTISLNHITMVLLMLHSNTDSIVWGRILLELSTKVENNFLKIARKIEREERQLRKGALPAE